MAAAAGIRERGAGQNAYAELASLSFAWFSVKRAVYIDFKKGSTSCCTGSHSSGWSKWYGSFKTEMSLQVLAYNMKRMINIFGVKPLMRAIAA